MHSLFFVVKYDLYGDVLAMRGFATETFLVFMNSKFKDQ